MAAQPPANDDRFYTPSSLLKWFGITSILMLILTIWMILEDNNRSWKGYQREFMSLRKAKLEQWVEVEKGELDQDLIAELKQEISDNEVQEHEKKAKVAELEDELRGLKAQLDIADVVWRKAKAGWDVRRYKYEAKYGHYDADAYIKELERLYEEEREARAAAKAAAAAEDEDADDEYEDEEEESDDGAEGEAEEVDSDEDEADSEAEDDSGEEEADTDDEGEDSAEVEAEEVPSPGLITAESLVERIEKADKDTAFKKEGAAEARKEVVQNLIDAYKFRDALNTIQQQYDAKEAEINAIYASTKQLRKDLEKSRGKLGLYETGIEESKFTIKKLIRSIPILDLADPVFKIHQIVLPHIQDDMVFAQVQKVDRCTTCHLGIDQPGFEDLPNPYKSHPRLDVMLGSTSPHPLGKIGCTVCHDGRGQAVEFTRAAHTPSSEAQKKEWEEKYHWHEMHHVPEKMLPLKYTEGRCVTCHKNTEYVPKGENINRATLLVKSAGCYGCHRIEGWDHLRKPGPSLAKVKGKLDRDFLVKWVRDPFTYNVNSRMPKVFHLSNMKTERYGRYQEAELFAAVDYIVANSEGYTPEVRLPAGNEERGKELFGKLGCLGCHQMDDFRDNESRSRFGRGPDLSTVGSKVSKDWLNQWLKDPRHYWKDTVMPSLRLSNSEISDLTSYLLSKKNPDFDSLEAGEAVLDDQIEVLKEYLARDPKLAPVTQSRIDDYIAKLAPHEIPIDLGKRTISRLGCYGCHDIKGFEGVQGIGAELSDWGSKMVKKLDFGHIPIERNRHSFLYQKLSEPRSYDKGTVKEYLDTLRMPFYGFSDADKHDIINLVLGRTAQKVGPPAEKVLSARESKAEDAHRIIHKYNCQGCHVIEGIHDPLPYDHPDYEKHERMRLAVEGQILSHYSEDETLGPPKIYKEGERVKSPWLHNFMHQPYPLRMKLEVRMPSFQMSNEEVNTLVEGWANEGGVEFPYIEEAPVRLSAQQLSDARKLFQTAACLNCHVAGTKLRREDMLGSKGLAPDFWDSHKRLHKDWIQNFLKNPQAMVPGTRMPGFWPDGSSPSPDILGGDAEAQIKLLTDYLYYLGQNKVER